MSRGITHHHSGGIGFAGLLTVLFIGLKLAGVIEWSWVWVLAPLWGGFAIVMAIVIGAVVLMLIGALLHKSERR